MPDNNHAMPPMRGLLRRFLTTGLGALENRGELFMVEAQEERTRVILLVALSVGGLFLGMLALLLLSGTIIFLTPPGYRIYAAGGFTFIYFVGCVGSFLGLRFLLKSTPFAESLAQLRKDRQLLDSLK